MVRVVDPSEILIDKEGTIKEDLFHANPWIRFLARFFDYSMLLLLLWIGRILLKGHLPLGKYESFIPFEFFVWIPIEAFFLNRLGTTPAKWFLKIKLHQGRRIKLSFQTALTRSFNVWFRGLGMMIPIINCICLLFAYYRLHALRQTSWDREEKISVSHAPIGRWRIITASIATVVIFLLYFSSKNQMLGIC